MQIQTPCIVIDLDKMTRNINHMSELCKKSDCQLRPHIKTHKMAPIAELQMQAGACGITVAKLSEAEVMADSGISDIFMAYPMVGEYNIQRAVQLAKQIRFIVSTDSLEAARSLSEAAVRAGIRFETRLEIDTGLCRSGVLYGQAERLAMQIAELPDIDLKGIYTHRGLIMDGKPSLDRKKCGLQEGEMLVSLANRLRGLGIDIVDVSPGSTPTAEFNMLVKGVTEVRPGTYVFYDMMQASCGACEMQDIAASVWTTVVSVSQPGSIVVDCGSKSISTDTARETFPFFLHGYGKVLDYDGLIFERMSEEHGILTKTDNERLEIGEILRIIPNHICPTVNLYDYVYVQKDGEIVKKWRVDARGRSQ